MKRGEIWLINLNPTIGAEIRKTRPAVIVSTDGLGVLPLRIIVPITDWKNRYAKANWMVKLEANSQNGLSKTSTADCFQVRSVSQRRMVKKIGEIAPDRMSEIEQALAIVLKIKK